MEEPICLPNPQELILKYRKRLTEVFKYPNPYTKPLYEFSEIKQKIKELERINKK